MGISIGPYNVESIKVQSNLRRSTDLLGKTFQRLSSGLRINSASDDPAGLALADSLKRNSRLSAVAIRNANDGLSITATAGEALNEISGILLRMSELATQSSNGVYSTAQRSALQLEFDAQGSEIERVSKSVEFNGIKLLSASGSISLQVGIDGTANSTIVIDSALATLSSFGLGNVAGALVFSISGTTINNAVTASQAALSAITTAQNVLESARGRFAAAESRLNTAVNYLAVSRENYIAAESRIRDADIAEESANLARLQVLQQAGVAVLAQANQTPSLVLKLLS